MSAASTPSPNSYPTTLRFDYSHAALATAILAVVLTTVPVGRADVALAGFVAMWAGIYLFMRRSVRTIRYFAPMMLSMVLWFALVSVSGSLNRWAPRADAAEISTPTRSTQISGPDLHGDARIAGPEILLTNRGTTPWTDVSVTLTASDGQTYTSHLDQVQAGANVAIHLSRFFGQDGRAVRIATMKPRAVAVRGQIDGVAGSFESRQQ
jgi:hypothetical protein